MEKLNEKLPEIETEEVVGGSLCNISVRLSLQKNQISYYHLRIKMYYE